MPRRALLDQAQDVLSEIEKGRDDLEGIVRASRDAAADIGVSRHAAHFAEEADDNAKTATAWLRATAVAAGLTFLAVAGNVVYTFLASAGKSDLNIQLVIAKVLAFSLLLSATLWCGRLYRAARHNYVVNRHRQNALSSFQAFVEAAGDEQTKNAVLLHAAQSIFAAQPSGLVPSDSEPTGTSHLIELVRTVSPSPKASL